MTYKYLRKEYLACSSSAIGCKPRTYQSPPVGIVRIHSSSNIDKVATRKIVAPSRNIEIINHKFTNLRLINIDLALGHINL